MKKISNLTSLIIIIMISQLTLAAHIKNWDINVDFANSGYTRRISFGFLLPSGLSQTDYLQIVFPIGMHSTATGNIPDNLKAELSYVGLKGCSSVARFTTNIFIDLITVHPSTYYIQFLDNNNQPLISLRKNEWYILKMFFTGTGIPPNQAIGITDPIILRSVSAIDAKAIVYDYNNVIGNLEFIAPPTNTLIISHTSSGAEKNRVLGIYDIFIDVTPTIEIKNEARIIMTMTNQKFL